MNRMTRKTAPIVAATMLLALVPGMQRASARELTGAAEPRALSATIGAPTLRAPVAKPQLERAYLQPTSDYSAGHRGVDYLVSMGESVLAPADGTIWFAAKVVNRSVVTIKLAGSGNLAEVEPVCPSVQPGDVVLSGQIIGQVCDADQSYQQHCENLRCLHFSYRTANGYLSPIAVMGQLNPSRLLPWTDL